MKHVILTVCVVGAAICQLQAQTFLNSNSFSDNRKNITGPKEIIATPLEKLVVERIAATPMPVSLSNTTARNIQNISVSSLTSAASILQNTVTASVYNSLSPELNGIQQASAEIQVNKNILDTSRSEALRIELINKINNQNRRVAQFTASLRSKTEALRQSNQINIAIRKRLIEAIDKAQLAAAQNQAELDARDAEITKLRKEHYGLAGKYYQLKNDDINRLSISQDTLLKKLEVAINSKEWLVGQDSLGVTDHSGIIDLRDTLRDNTIALAGMNAQKNGLIAAFKVQNEKHKTYQKVLELSPQTTIDDLKDSIGSTERKTDSLLQEITTSLNAVSTNLLMVENKYNTSAKIVKEILAKYPKKEIPKEESFATWVGFKKLLKDQGLLVPDITLLGNLKYGSESLGGVAQFKLFTGLGSSNINSPGNIAAAFVVPEASTFGFTADMGLGFKLAAGPQLEKLRKNNTHDLGFKTGFNFLSKSLKLADTSFSTNLLQWKFGLELIPFKHFSVRSNINGLNTISQDVMLAKYFTNVKSTKWYVDIGLSALLDFIPSKDFKIFFDLNLIPVSESLKKFTGITDKIITQIKVELRKNF